MATSAGSFTKHPWHYKAITYKAVMAAMLCIYTCRKRIFLNYVSYFDVSFDCTDDLDKEEEKVEDENTPEPEKDKQSAGMCGVGVKY